MYRIIWRWLCTVSTCSTLRTVTVHVAILHQATTSGQQPDRCTHGGRTSDVVFGIGNVCARDILTPVILSLFHTCLQGPEAGRGI